MTDENSKLVYTNVMKMLKARFYGEAVECSLPEEFEETFDKIFKCQNIEGDDIHIIFLDNKRLNISAVRGLVNYLGVNTNNKTNKKKCHGIVIHEETPTSSGTHQLATLGATGCCTIELFKESFFYNCIIEHDLVPIHEKVPKLEADMLKKKFGIGKMMQLISSYPISRFYEFKPGDIVKITRKNGSIVYREVRK